MADHAKNFWNGFSSYYIQNLEEHNLLSALGFVKMLRLDSAQNILEVGCGSGSLTLHQLERLPPGIKYTSIDLSDKMIEAAQEKKENLKHRLNKIDHSFIVGNAEDLESIPDESVDVYIAPLLLHLVPNPQKVLKEAMRVLKKGGRFGMSVLGPAEENTFFNIIDIRILEALEQKSSGKGMYYLGEKEVLVKLVQDAGIEVDFCWDHDVMFDIFDEKELEKTQMNPNFARILADCSEKVQTQLWEGVKKDFAELKKNLTPMKLNDVMLVGRKPN